MYYSKKEIYELDWKVNLEENIVTAGKFGGPIAITIDCSNPELKNPNTDFFIYNSAGILISQFQVS